jgi:K+-transporting ATPase ATPase C chain
MIGMLRPVLVLFFLLTLIIGIGYPLLITGIGRLVFPDQASGSLIARDGHAVGSRLIGQSFQDPKYFWGRLSATTPMPNNGLASGGSNYGPTNPALLDAVKARIAALKAPNPSTSAGGSDATAIPVDLVTSSASGLDPEITPAAALYQAERVARVRGLSLPKVRQLVDQATQGPQWGIFGEPRVNVVLLNLALDRAQ